MKSFTLLFLLLGFSILQIHAQKLTPYTCVVDHVDQERWMKDYQRKLDSIGVVTQKREYHALSIAMFGIMNYENYLLTGDSVYYNNVLNQYKYFSDDSRVVFTDNEKGMGLPYHFKFKDLQPIWYSGMTQGYAISFLLRYYDLTKDNTALKKVEQLAYFMLKPVSEGGTIGKTPEGYTFIEEYPGSKNAPQVLNGFINGLIGLREYLDYFPKDTLARRIHDESYQAMINTFEHYDTPSWTNYARKGGAVTNHYMRYQLCELEHLNYIYNDSALVRQKMLWSYFASTKYDTKFQSHKNPKYKYAEKLVLKDSLYQFSNHLTLKRLGPSGAYQMIQNKKEIKPGKYFKTKKPLVIHFDTPVFFGVVFLDSNAKNVKVKPHDIQYNLLNDSLYFESEEPIESLVLNIQPQKGKKMKVNRIELIDTRKFPTSEFGVHLVDSVYLLNQMLTYEIEVLKCNNPQTLVFYRFHNVEKDIKNSKWKQYQYFNKKDTFMPSETGYYQFLIVTPNVRPGIKFEKLQVKEI